MQKLHMLTAFLQRYSQLNPEALEQGYDGIEYIFVDADLYVRMGDEGYEYLQDDEWEPLETVSQLKKLLGV